MQQNTLQNIDHKTFSKIKKIHKNKLEVSNDDRYLRYVDAVKLIKPIRKNLKQTVATPLFQLKNGKVILGDGELVDDQDKKVIYQAIKNMVPWRKGPFEVCGIPINAEWRSDIKWERVKKKCGSLQGKVILDVGCNNGYYLYQIAKQKPKYLMGIDPVIPYYLQYQLLQNFYPLPNTDFFLLGVHDLKLIPKTFDVIFCMGILYHHPDPVHILRILFDCLKPGGLLIVESLGINKEGAYCLFPKTRYLKMPGHWFVPTQEALENMIRRSGFQYVETFFSTPLGQDEQRKTDLCPVDSLIDGLNPKDSTRTVEGYDAPWRYYVKARRARIRR